MKICVNERFRVVRQKVKEKLEVVIDENRKLFE